MGVAHGHAVLLLRAGFCERAAVNQSVITPNHPSDSNIAEGADVQTYLNYAKVVPYSVQLYLSLVTAPGGATRTVRVPSGLNTKAVLQTPLHVSSAPLRIILYM